jgi:hypothetical protein
MQALCGVQELLALACRKSLSHVLEAHARANATTRAKSRAFRQWAIPGVALETRMLTYADI